MKQLSFEFMGIADYDPDMPPGSFEHASGDCRFHGENVVFFRVHKAIGPRYCVLCALEVLR